MVTEFDICSPSALVRFIGAVGGEVGALLADRGVVAAVDAVRTASAADRGPERLVRRTTSARVARLAGRAAPVIGVVVVLLAGLDSIVAARTRRILQDRITGSTDDAALEKIAAAIAAAPLGDAAAARARADWEAALTAAFLGLADALAAGLSV